MANIDTALKDAIMNCIGPENCTKCEYRNVPGSKVRCKTMLLRDALELLLLKDSEPVVRCKDCKWWKDYKCENDFVLRQIFDCGCYPDFHTDSEWFCAEGERR
jgi:hypothetical protein